MNRIIVSWTRTKQLNRRVLSLSPLSNSDGHCFSGKAWELDAMPKQSIPRCTGISKEFIRAKLLLAWQTSTVVWKIVFILAPEIMWFGSKNRSLVAWYGKLCMLKINHVYRAQTSLFIYQKSKEIVVARPSAKFAYFLNSMHNCHSFKEANLSSEKALNIQEQYEQFFQWTA